MVDHVETESENLIHEDWLKVTGNYYSIRNTSSADGEVKSCEFGFTKYKTYIFTASRNSAFSFSVINLSAS